MMKKFKLFLLLNLIAILSSCGTVKEGFVNQKKNNSDEFLVEKKSPLVMPPDFNELPIPKVYTNKSLKNKSEIKKLIVSQEDENTKSENIKNINRNLEESLLEKIKNN